MSFGSANVTNVLIIVTLIFGGLYLVYIHLKNDMDFRLQKIDDKITAINTVIQQQGDRFDTKLGVIHRRLDDHIDRPILYGRRASDDQNEHGFLKEYHNGPLA